MRICMFVFVVPWVWQGQGLGYFLLPDKRSKDAIGKGRRVVKKGSANERQFSVREPCIRMGERPVFALCLMNEFVMWAGLLEAISYYVSRLVKIIAIFPRGVKAKTSLSSPKFLSRLKRISVHLPKKFLVFAGWRGLALASYCCSCFSAEI